MSNKTEAILAALREKFPETQPPDVRFLSDEQKAWLQMKIQSLADGTQSPQVIVHLQKIRNRLIHATEDIPDGELQKMVSFVFENMSEIEGFSGEEKHKI